MDWPLFLGMAATWVMSLWFMYVVLRRRIDERIADRMTRHLQAIPVWQAMGQDLEPPDPVIGPRDPNHDGVEEISYNVTMRHPGASPLRWVGAQPQAMPIAPLKEGLPGFRHLLPPIRTPADPPHETPLESLRRVGK